MLINCKWCYGYILKNELHGNVFNPTLLTAIICTESSVFRQNEPTIDVLTKGLLRSESLEKKGNLLLSFSVVPCKQ